MRASGRLVIPTSLRSRLLLAFLALVSLVLFVGVASFTINRQVRSQVARLRSSDIFDLRNVDLAKVGLEIEGYYNPSGSFVATDVEITPTAQRPRLRGEIQTVDPLARTITLYGVEIHVAEGTDSADEARDVVFTELRAGARVEVICTVEAGRWEARKIQLRDVKASDKVKGTATASELDGLVPETLVIHGLQVVVEPATAGGPESALGRIEKATQMILALQECRSAAHDLVLGPHTRARNGEGDDSDPLAPAAERLTQTAHEFARLVQLSHAEGDDPRVTASPAYLRALRPLANRQASLSEHVTRLGELVRSDPARAAEELDETFDPFLQEQLMPLVYAYLGQSEEDLGDQLRGVLGRTATTTWVALATSVIAAIVAFVLGFLVWRSIHRPIRALHDAALRLGQGHLETRIQLESHDEIGVLAEAFNKMASDLASTTVSMRSLENVFDSMAAALIVFDPQGRIVNVNLATLDLVGRERDELIGQTFGFVCRHAAGESVGASVQARADGAIVSDERVFVHRDGREIPVSFSGAELRSRGGQLQGYVCVAQDLTEQKRVQERLEDSLGEKELLLREVHHRVKNNMQVISSLLAMQATGGDPDVIRRLEESQNRIRSIALIHEQLYRSTELEHIDVRTYLEVLTNQLLQSFGKAGQVELELEVDPITLDIDQSMACGLIVNELVTNALKHAYPGARTGTIRVSLHEGPDGERALTVADDGPGLSGSMQGRTKTLGMSLIATLARQLRGRVEVDDREGTAVRIHFPRRVPVEALAS